MKNRNSPAPPPTTTERSDPDLRRRAPDRSRRPKTTASSGSFLEKGARVLQNYSSVIGRSSYHGGDPDLFFRRTLRNYDDLDFYVGGESPLKFSKLLRLVKPSDQQKPERRRSASHIGSGDTKDKFRGLSKSSRTARPATSQKNRKSTRRAEEDGSQLFYSPLSFAASSVSSISKKSKMEEEGGLTDDEMMGGISEDEGGASAPLSDPLTETEELVKRAEDDLDQLDQTLEEGENAESEGEQGPGSQAAVAEEQPPIEPKPSAEPAEAKSPGEPAEAVSPGEPAEAVSPGEPAEAVSPGEPAPARTPSTPAPAAPSPSAPMRYEEPPRDIDDQAILREVAECETQCSEISRILVELKQRVSALLSKPSRSPEEDRELDRNQRELNEKMMLLEQKTKRVEYLMSLSRKKAKYDQPQTEDILPKVILCGVADNNMPKIIVCDDKKKKKREKIPIPFQKNAEVDCICGNRPAVEITDPPFCTAPPRMPSSNVCHPRRPPPCTTCAKPPPQPEENPCYPGGPSCPVMKGQSKRPIVPSFAQRLCESYNMQEKLAAENADLEGKSPQNLSRRYQLQSDLLNQDQTVESLQRKLNSMQAEMRMVLKENAILNEKLDTNRTSSREGRGDSSRGSSRTRKMSCGKGLPCPKKPESEQQLTHQLEKQLTDMEEEVRKMQTELLAVRQERMHLEQHRRMLCTPPCPPSPSPGSVPPCSVPPCAVPGAVGPGMQPSPCPGPCNPNRPSGISADQQLRELREQYNTLQDDYKGKLVEVAGLRTDVEKLKKKAVENEESKRLADKKIAELEKELKDLRGDSKSKKDSKEGIIELEQQLSTAKQRYREVKDELEEVRALVEEQKSQLDDYRNKYLQAQQQVEEQRRQIDMMELENGRISEQVNLEIQRVKNQFQEKLQELTPLPDILKATQLKLQEAQQMHLLAERNNEALVRELQAYRDKAAAMAKEMDTARSMASLGEDEKLNMQARVEELQAKCNELMEEAERMKTEMLVLKETAEEAEKLAQEKMHQIAQLSAEVDNVREESARQVARTKDRCETVRRSMQNQISDMERQLAQSRAQARAAQKDRDEIRQKMQAQINNLNENFEDAQMRIRNLQGHVNFLKNSYTNVFPAEPNVVSDKLEPCNCGNTKF